jgi:hypothetical protein
MVEVKNITGARFIGYYASWPDMANQAFNAEQVNAQNATLAAKNEFDGLCSRWTSEATAAVAAKTALPPKPIAKPSRVAVREDMPFNQGTYIATVDGDPVGVCPDLPAELPVAPGTISGLVQKGTPTQPTIDDKLNYISSQLSKLMVKAGVV